MGAGARRAGIGCHDEPSDPQAWLDLQKKSVAASERDEEARSAWRKQVASFDSRRLVFVDECGTTNIGLTSLRARAPKGERAHGRAPRNRGKNTTRVAALTSEGGMGPSVAVKGSTSAKRQGIRGVRRALPGSLTEERAGRGDGQP